MLSCVCRALFPGKSDVEQLFVFLALPPSGGRVAIKRIRALRLPGHDSWKNAEREADILCVVEHPHVVSLLDHVVIPQKCV